MMIRRRELLIGGAMAGGAALGGLRAAGAAMALPAKLEPGGAVLFLHDGGREAAAYGRRLAAAVHPGRVTVERIAVLAPGGFGRARGLLDRAGAARLVTLTDTGAAVALELMLHARGVALIDRKPAGDGATLLGAVIGAMIGETA